MKIIRVNYLTDDPWNPVHRAPWFTKALHEYDYLFSTRRANLKQLQNASHARVYHLPFAYNPNVHFPVALLSEKEKEQFDCDVVFIGGADPDRIPCMKTLAQQGFNLHLYGGYWDRTSALRCCFRGHVGLEIVRKAVSGAKIVLCLVREANRDGSSMRSFEVPAMGGCMLMIDTEEHREIFGKEGENVLYFKTKDEMVEKAKWLLAHPSERERLKKAAHQCITAGGHTYRDRLETMLKTVWNRV